MTDLKCDHAWQKIPDPAAICPKCWSIKTEFSVFPPTESFAAGETPAQAPGQEERPLRASSLPSSSGSVLRKADAGGANLVAAQSEEKEDGRDSVAGSSGSDCPGNNERGEHPVALPPVERGDIHWLADKMVRGVCRCIIPARDECPEPKPEGCYYTKPLPPSSDVKELVERLKALKIRTLFDEDMGRWEYDPLPQDAAAMLQRQEWVINAMKRESDDWERAYKKLEAKFWEVRDAGIKAEDALEALTEKLERYETVVRDFVALMQGDLSGTAQWNGVLKEARALLQE